MFKLLVVLLFVFFIFFFQAEDGIRDRNVTGVQTCALPISFDLQLGDEKAAVAWLVAEKKVKSDLPVRDFKLTPQFGDLTFLRAAASIAFDALGLISIARQIEQAGVGQAVDQLSLDGMLALWRPAATN